MKGTSSLDNFHLAPPGLSDSPPPESDDCDALPVGLLETFLSNADTDTPAAQPAPPRRFTLPKSDDGVEQAKLAAIPVKTQSDTKWCTKLWREWSIQRCYKWIRTPRSDQSDYRTSLSYSLMYVQHKAMQLHPYHARTVVQQPHNTDTPACRHISIQCNEYLESVLVVYPSIGQVNESGGSLQEQGI